MSNKFPDSKNDYFSNSYNNIKSFLLYLPDNIDNVINLYNTIIESAEKFKEDPQIKPLLEKVKIIYQIIKENRDEIAGKRIDILSQTGGAKLSDIGIVLYILFSLLSCLLFYNYIPRLTPEIGLTLGKQWNLMMGTINVFSFLSNNANGDADYLPQNIAEAMFMSQHFSPQSTRISYFQSENDILDDVLIKVDKLFEENRIKKIDWWNEVRETDVGNYLKSQYSTELKRLESRKADLEVAIPAHTKTLKEKHTQKSFLGNSLNKEKYNQNIKNSNIPGIEMPIPRAEEEIVRISGIMGFIGKKLSCFEPTFIVSPENESYFNQVVQDLFNLLDLESVNKTPVRPTPTARPLNNSSFNLVVSGTPNGSPKKFKKLNNKSFNVSGLVPMRQDTINSSAVIIKEFNMGGLFSTVLPKIANVINGKLPIKRGPLTDIGIFYLGMQPVIDTSKLDERINMVIDSHPKIPSELKRFIELYGQTGFLNGLRTAIATRQIQYTAARKSIEYDREKSQEEQFWREIETVRRNNLTDIDRISKIKVMMKDDKFYVMTKDLQDAIRKCIESPQDNSCKPIKRRDYIIYTKYLSQILRNKENVLLNLTITLLLAVILAGPIPAIYYSLISTLNLPVDLIKSFMPVRRRALGNSASAPASVPALPASAPTLGLPLLGNSASALVPAPVPAPASASAPASAPVPAPALIPSAMSSGPSFTQEQINQAVLIAQIMRTLSNPSSQLPIVAPSQPQQRLENRSQEGGKKSRKTVKNRVKKSKYKFIFSRKRKTA